MGSSWNTSGPDTVHLTYREGNHRNPIELAALLGEFQQMHDLPSEPRIRDRGVQGFASAAVDQAAGLRLDWTRPGDDGNNPGYFCLQVKGTWFENSDGETAADFLQLLQAYGPLRCTRLDFQQTNRTTEHLTPWFIAQFEAGALRVVGRKHYEPRGRKNAAGNYPEGATLYHGSRKSERFARQYDKHLEAGYGPSRRRDEVEAKGETSRNLWESLHEELLDCEQLGTSRGLTLGTYARRTIRALLPIRDTSRWVGKDLPRKWSEMAKEPTTWATLFDEEALQVKPREKRVSSWLKSYRYARENFGASVATALIHRRRQLIADGWDDMKAWEKARHDVIDEFVDSANGDRVREFLSELPPSMAIGAHQDWLFLEGCEHPDDKAERENRRM